MELKALTHPSPQVHNPNLPLNTALSNGGPEPLSNTWFLWPIRVTEIPSRSVQPFLLMAEHPYTLPWAAISPSKLPLPTRDLDPS